MADLNLYASVLPWLLRLCTCTQVATSANINFVES